MSERDPIDVAREAWALEWKERSPVWWTAKLGCLTVQLVRQDGMPKGWRVEVSGFSLTTAMTPEAALTEARRLTLARLEAAAAKCHEPYPVQVERHRKTGEAVLFLTSPHNGEVMAIARYLLDAEPDIRELGDGTTAIRIGKFGGLTNMYSVTEPAEAIRETLRMLAEENGA